MFPFWSLAIPKENKKFLGMFFGGIHDSDRIVIPAFRMANFEAMYRLAKRFSAAVKTMDMISLEDKQDGRFAPVDQPLSEALILTEAIIFREFIGRGIEPSQERTEFTPNDVSLFYAPFQPQSYFYVDSVHRAVTFEKNLIG
jgi:hypothetical protein